MMQCLIRKATNDDIGAQRLSISPGDVFIIIDEPPLENWGMGGQQKG